MATAHDIIDFDAEIARAISEPDPAVSNLKITRVHYLLSEALQEATGGPAAGANFHSWAIWGSRKAGVTIRQEDLDGALRDAARVAGTVGACVGLAAKRGIAGKRRVPFGLDVLAVALGAACGAAAGRAIATMSRRDAAAQILAGNQTVLEDIGTQTARFLKTFEYVMEANDALFAEFLDGFRPGDASVDGQDLLGAAFAQYYHARYSDDLKEKHEALYFGNCLAVYHEHVRLQPYIKDSMPWIIRECVTKRTMTFDVGNLRLAVSQAIGDEGDTSYPETLEVLDDPEIERFTAAFSDKQPISRRQKIKSAADWTKIEQRMRYIVKLFRTFHDSREVWSAPYSADLLGRIADADFRSAAIDFQTIISPVKTSVAAPVM